jgi:DNA polymerase-3 subunit alpha
MSFVGLHIHTDYSLLDGASQIPKLIDKAIELGMPAIALTDHGVMYGAIELIKACRGKGIKPIIGNEMYVINEPLDTTARCRRYHQVVLAKNTKGYKNLVKLTTISSLEGIHGKGIFARPCINKELLEQYHEDLIVTSACLGGEIPQAILQNKLDVARKVAKWYKKLFGDDYYLELQDHGSQEDRIVNVELVKIARELNIKLIATNDSHFISCYDVEAHDALLCIQTGKLITEDKRLRYSGTEYMKSAEEMALLFRDHLSDEVIQEAIANTLEVASKIEPYHILGEPRIPDFQCPPGETPNTYVEWIAKEGLKERFKVKSYEEIPQVYRDRLVYEVKMLQQMGFAAYFLVVWDYIKYARDRGIPVGPGRGSAAGSLVAYAMQITNIDPVHHGLLFERFLNPERKSMPDIDTDFCISRRDEVIQYVTEKYGKERVAQIITFNRMTSKAVLKDVARVLGVPYKKSDEMAKLIPVARGKPEKLAVMISDKSPAPEFREAYVKNEGIPRDDGTVVEFRQWLDMAIRIEGTNKSSGVHAAGVVISADRLDEIVPLQKNNDGATITQYPMEDLESLGLLKMDFLGLKNLTMIQKTLDYIKETKHLDFDPYQFPAEERRAQEVRGRGVKKFPKDIENTYNILERGDLEGVFQLESSGMKQIVQELKPSSLEDISSILALYRPGPLDAGLIPKFIDRKHGREAIQYEHPMLETILNETYGILCLPKGTQINKPDGSTVAIEDIQPGDWVLTSNGHQVWKAKVANQWHSGSKEILKITLSSGTVIYTSKSHRFLTPEGDKEAWELKAGPGGLKNAHIYSSVLYEQWPISNNSKQLHPHEAYLLGLFIGDGNLVSSTPNIACSTEETAEYVANLIGSTWGGEPKYYFHTRCWYAYSKFKTQPKPTPLTQFMDGLYGGRSWKVKSQQKHLPADVLDYCEGDRLDLLRGLWDSDGCYHPTLLYFRSSSPQLLQQVGLLLGSLKISYAVLDNYVYVLDRTRFKSRLGKSQLPAKLDEGIVDNYLAVAANRFSELLTEAIATTDSKTRQAINTALQNAPLFKPKASQYKQKLDRWDEFYHHLYAETYLQDARYVYVMAVEEAGVAECFDLQMEDQSSPYFLAEGVVTHNCYQEQIMKVAQDLGGYSLGQADLLRRAMGKKKPEEMNKHRELFLDGATKNGVSKSIAENLFNQMLLFAEYCFNKSHSTAYGYVTYQTAYLKANYPVEYMAALLTSNSGDQDKVQKYIANCQELNITVQGPDINRSGVDFTPVDANAEKGTILFGLSAVKNIGDNAIHAILTEREANGRFHSLADLCDRINLHTVNSRALEALIKCGALDGLNPNRKQAIEYMPLAIKWAQDRAKEQETGQLNLFDQLAVMTETSTFESAPVPPNIADFPVEEKLQFEKELLGFYVSEHPLKNAGRIAEQLGIEVVSLGKLDEQKSRTKISVLVVLTEVKQILTKKDERRMAFLQMEDIEGKAEAVVFPDTYEQFHELLIPDTPILIDGKVDRRDDRTQLIVEEAKVLKLDELTSLPEAVIPKRITEMILLELTTDLIHTPAMLDHLKVILQEHSADKTKATVPAVAIIVKAGDRHRVAAICGPNFWVQDCHNVVRALNSAGFPALVYSLPPGNGMGNLPPFSDPLPFEHLTVPYLNSIRSILQELDEG